MVSIKSNAAPRYPNSQYLDIGALISGAASFVGSLFGSEKNAAATRYAAEKQLDATQSVNATNLQLAREQNDWNYDMWQKTNEYNSTANQLARWTAAGLNPNSFASQASPVAANTIQSADLANQQVPEIGQYYAQEGNAWAQGIQNAFNSLMSFKGLQIQEKKANAEIENLGANSTFVKEQVKQILPAQAKELGARAALSEKTVESIQKSYAKLDAEVENLYAQANLADTRSNESKISMKWMRETWDKRMLSLDLANQLQKAHIGLTYQQCHNLAEEFKGIILNNGIKGNEVAMLGVTNFIKKVNAISEFSKMTDEQERSSYYSTIFGALSTAIQSLSFSSQGFDQLHERNSVRDSLMNEARNSWLNPLPSK